MSHAKTGAKVQKLLEALPDAVVIADADGRIMLVNRQAEKLFDYDRNDLLGHPVEILLPERFRDMHVGHRARYFSAPYARPICAGRGLIGRRRDGTEFPVEISLGPMETEEGLLVIAAVHDITERKQTEETIEASLKEKEVLLREVYHRVKNNLQVIASLLSLQAASSKDPQAATMFRESQNRVKAMALVHEKLYQSHDLANIDFNAYIQSLVMSLLRSYGVLANAIAVNISVENVSLSLDTAVPCGLLVNELVSNALKHAFPRLDRSKDEKGELTIRLRPVGQDTFELIVRDNGIGMPPAVDLAHPESFGLKLIATLARQLRGTLECRSNGGTEMRLVIREAGDQTRS
jgi:PAS domain S-box-containing protein